MAWRRAGETRSRDEGSASEDVRWASWRRFRTAQRARGYCSQVLHARRVVTGATTVDARCAWFRANAVLGVENAGASVPRRILDGVAGAGRVDAAIESYEAALAVVPEYLPAVQGIACLTLKRGRADERLGGWLDEIALRCDQPGWREWARTRAIAAR